MADAGERRVQMADINKVFAEAQKLNWNIESLLRLSTFEPYGDLSGLHIDYEDSEQLFLSQELREILEKLDMRPRESLMVGNDTTEDTAAEALGMGVFLIDACLIDKEGKGVDAWPHGGFDELVRFLRE